MDLTRATAQANLLAHHTITFAAAVGATAAGHNMRYIHVASRAPVARGAPVAHASLCATPYRAPPQITQTTACATTNPN
jgi:hypothetical protein